MGALGTFGGIHPLTKHPNEKLVRKRVRTNPNEDTQYESV